jgi:Ca2+-binding RTX toxin-like protein
LALYSIVKSAIGTAAGDALSVRSLYTTSQLTATGAYCNYATTLSSMIGNDTLSGWGGPLNWTQFATATPTETLIITNQLNGGDGNDLLISGQRLPDLTAVLAPNYTLTETLAGGVGNDTYRLNHTNVTITESANSGTDIVVLTPAYLADSLALNRFVFSLVSLANVERILLQGTANFNAVGNSLSNAIWGNLGQNMLYGSAGHDVLYGGAGNDRLYGGTGNDTLRGDDGADLLNGDIGNDIMSGGAGNDTYIIDSAADSVIELANMGTDKVQSANVALSSTVYFGVEILQLTGNQDLNIEGGDSATQLFGNAGRNVISSGGKDGESLFGGGGDDQIYGATAYTSAELYGGIGNDYFYIYDQQLDHIHEGINGGFDTVSSTVTTLDASKSLGGLSLNIEALELLGSENINLTGGGNVRLLIGNLGYNMITGAEAAETFLGGGNTDTLFGGSGADTLIGGAENDEIYGGEGSDSFVFGLIEVDGIDYLADFQTGDTLNLHTAAAQFTLGAALIASSAVSYLSMPVSFYQIDFNSDGTIDLAFFSHNPITLADITAGFS